MAIPTLTQDEQDVLVSIVRKKIMELGITYVATLFIAPDEDRIAILEGWLNEEKASIDQNLSALDATKAASETALNARKTAVDALKTTVDPNP